MRNVNILLILSLAFSSMGLFADEGAPQGDAAAPAGEVAQGDKAEKAPVKKEEKKKPAAKGEKK